MSAYRLLVWVSPTTPVFGRLSRVQGALLEAARGAFENGASQVRVEDHNGRVVLHLERDDN